MHLPKGGFWRTAAAPTRTLSTLSTVTCTGGGTVWSVRGSHPTTTRAERGRERCHFGLCQSRLPTHLCTCGTPTHRPLLEMNLVLKINKHGQVATPTLICDSIKCVLLLNVLVHCMHMPGQGQGWCVRGDGTCTGPAGCIYRRWYHTGTGAHMHACLPIRCHRRQLPAGRRKRSLAIADLSI